MTEIISNGSKWYGEQLDTLDDLKEVLKIYTLDPTFENYGNFINRNPKWLKSDTKEKYKGCALISGNFLSYSHVFNIITDDQELILEIEQLVNDNKKRNEYIINKLTIKQ